MGNQNDDKTDDALLAEWVAQALEEEEEHPGSVGTPLEVLCADRPELAPVVADALEAAREIRSRQSEGMQRDPLLGSALADRYRINDRIGAGAMGVVYSATDVELKRDVAIKILGESLVDRGQAGARFDREATALAAVTHDAVVRIFDRGFTENGAPYLVMERVQGVSLAALLEESSKTSAKVGRDWPLETFGIEPSSRDGRLRQSVRWAAEIAEGLVAAHASGVTHRDVKPSNVMIRKDGHAVLLDFGLATHADQVGLTRTDAALGTPAYMPPEALDSQTSYGPSHDVYGVAATIYHLVTGVPPYQGSVTDVFTALATRPPRPARTIKPDLPKDVQAILDWGLARSADDRYSDASALASDLRGFLAHESIQARPVPAIVHKWRAVKRSGVARGAALALFATVLLGIGVLARNKVVTDRAERANAAFTLVPPNLTFVDPLDRKVADPDAATTIVSKLTELADLTPSRPEPRLLLALFLQDQGSSDLASQHWSKLADSLSSELASHLFADDPATWSREILGSTPRPETERDAVVLALLALRFTRQYESEVEAYGAAKSYLEPFRSSVGRYGAELFLPIDWVTSSTSIEDRLARGLRSVEALHAQFGAPSAMALHWEAFFLGGQRRYPEAFNRAHSGLGLAYDSHTLWENVAHLARRQARYDDARSAASRALAIAPNNRKALIHRVMVELDSHRYQEAREFATSIPAGRAEASPDLKASLLATVDQREAISLFLDDSQDPEVVAAYLDLARRASAGFESLEAPSRDDKFRYRLAQAVLSNDKQSLFQTQSLLARVAKTQRSYDFAIRCLPEVLNDESVVALRKLHISAVDAMRRAGMQPLVSLSPTNPTPK